MRVGHDFSFRGINTKGTDLAVGSCYLDVGVGFEEPNNTKLTNIAAFIRLMSIPFILAWGFNKAWRLA